MTELNLEGKAFYRLVKVISNFLILFAVIICTIVMVNDSETIVNSIGAFLVSILFVDILRQSILYIAYGKKITFNFLKKNKSSATMKKQIRFENQIEQAAPPERSSRGAIKKFLRGEYGLCKTYWGSKLFMVAFFTSALLWYKTLFLSTQIKYHFVLVAVVFSILVPIYIAIYKAAMKYKGNNTWSVLAVLSLIVGLAQILPLITIDSSENINRQISQIKKSVPIKINSLTDMVDADYRNGLVSFTYKVKKEKLSSPLNKASRIVKLCKKNELFSLPSVNKIQYRYIDNESSVLLQFVVDKTLCNSIAAMGEKEYYLNSTIQNLRKRLPVKVDELTEVVNISKSKEKISYHYKLNVPPSPEAITKVRRYISANKSSIIKSFCKSSEQLFEFRNLIQYIYKSADGQNIEALNINKGDCGNLSA